MVGRWQCRVYKLNQDFCARIHQWQKLIRLIESDCLCHGALCGKVKSFQVKCISQGLTQLEGLVDKVADVLHSRAESNLRAVQATRLVDLPPDHTSTQEEFPSHQAAFVKRQAERLAIRSDICSPHSHISSETRHRIPDPEVPERHGGSLWR